MNKEQVEKIMKDWEKISEIKQNDESEIIETVIELETMMNWLFPEKQEIPEEPFPTKKDLESRNLPTNLNEDPKER